MLVSDREAAFNEKHIKMLMMYMMHFGKVKNVVFRVHASYHKTDDIIGYQTHVSIQQAKLAGPGGTPLQSDLQKFCSMMELCPDIVLVNKKATSQTYGTSSYNIITYDLESINCELDFIRSEFFK